MGRAGTCYREFDKSRRASRRSGLPYRSFIPETRNFPTSSHLSLFQRVRTEPTRPCEKCKTGFAQPTAAVG